MNITSLLYTLLKKEHNFDESQYLEAVCSSTVRAALLGEYYTFVFSYFGEHYVSFFSFEEHNFDDSQHRNCVFPLV